MSINLKGQPAAASLRHLQAFSVKWATPRFNPAWSLDESFWLLQVKMTESRSGVSSHHPLDRFVAPPLAFGLEFLTCTLKFPQTAGIKLDQWEFPSTTFCFSFVAFLRILRFFIFPLQVTGSEVQKVHLRGEPCHKMNYLAQSLSNPLRVLFILCVSGMILEHQRVKRCPPTETYLAGRKPEALSPLWISAMSPM